MKNEVIFRLSKLCLPMLLVDETSINFDGLTRSDLQVDTIQRLWAGMGHIYRVSYGAHSFVIKHICPPPIDKQSYGDRRKALSYEVEAAFYKTLAQLLIDEHDLALPRPLHVEQHFDAKLGRQEIIICMSYVDSSRARQGSEKDYIRAVLTWLATLHASHWGEECVDEIVEQVGLQKQGSYWYLDTRPDEHDNMPSKGWEGRLKRAARAIDSRLTRDDMQCLIHGDAKDANVMMTDSGSVVMCDFQYLGKGPPTKDLAYFFYTAVDVKNETETLQYYLHELSGMLPADATPPTLAQVQESLDLAFCDFTRFMSGWGYWGGNMENRVRAVLDRLDNGKDLGSEEAYEAAMHREFG
ncbi:hypothetical protein MPSEU_000134900 [Mayamaea pseudoterrestris]|nr:hypothetical protein MPSEU_000134900 [Mayamaea pseudoterrestris]